MYTRRTFLKRSSLASASLLVPNFLRRSSAWLQPEQADGKVLVVVQLSGGNDGLNTVIPYRNDLYYKNRPGIGIARQDAFRLSDELGLHPSMTGVKELYDEGFLSIVNSVGYPNPNRSHFRSMDIWHTASDAHQVLSTGWIGRMLDARCPDNCAMPYMAMEVDDTLSLALKGKSVKGMAVSNPTNLYNNTRDPFFYALAKEVPVASDQRSSHAHVDFLHKTLRETTASVEYVYEKSRIYQSRVEYPVHAFARQLKTVAELIIANSDTRVYYVSLAGFDTHISQKGAHSNLLGQYASGIRAFVADLRQNRRFEDTLIMTFSEFGRRVKQNASRGTDHGTANNLFLIGGGLKKPGIYNRAPNLGDLDEGDLKFEIDFRQVYATVLNKWLNTASKMVLGRSFEQLGVI